MQKDLNLDRVDGLHQAWVGEQEGGVGDAARSRDHLAAAAIDRLIRDLGVQDLELDVANRLVAQRALARAPLETVIASVPRSEKRHCRTPSAAHP